LASTIQIFIGSSSLQPLAICKFAFSASALAQMGGKHRYAAVDTTPDATVQDLKVARVTLFGLIAYKQRLFSP
jgi:hypothetical protein